MSCPTLSPLGPKTDQIQYFLRPGPSSSSLPYSEHCKVVCYCSMGCDVSRGVKRRRLYEPLALSIRAARYNWHAGRGPTYPGRRPGPIAGGPLQVPVAGRRPDDRFTFDQGATRLISRLWHVFSLRCLVSGIAVASLSLCCMSPRSLDSSADPGIRRLGSRASTAARHGRWKRSFSTETGSSKVK
jgi:hypothetical protein